MNQLNRIFILFKTALNSSAKEYRYLLIHRNIIKIVLFTISMMLSANTYALNWERGFGASISTSYDDNYSLLAEDEVANSLTNLGLNISGIGKNEMTQVNLSAALNGSTNSEDSLDDRITGTFLFSLNQSGERLQKKLSLSYFSEPTIKTEVLDTGVIVDSTKNTLSLATGINYSLDERNSLSVNFSIDDISYETPSLNEYQNASIGINWGYQLSETSRMTSDLSLSRYDPETEDVTDTVGLKFGYETSPSESTRYSLSAGLSSVNGPGIEKTSGNYSVTVSHKPDNQNNLSISLNRSFQASGQGALREQDSLGFNWSSAFTEKLKGNFSANYIGTDNRDYFDLQPGMKYILNRYNALSCTITFRDQNADIGDATSKGILLSYSYNR